MTKQRASAKRKRCAYLTMRNPGDFVTDYHLSYEAMTVHGWQVETVSWQDASIVHWTLGKTYLRDLEEQGAAILPSIWFDDIDTAGIPGWFTALGCNTAVVKPVIGGNATDTYVLTDPVGEDLISHLGTTKHVLSLVDPEPVYVRADFVRGSNGQYWLMELELIEPSLYLRMDDGAAARFAAAFDDHVLALKQK